jgi:hypothetical protein
MRHLRVNRFALLEGLAQCRQFLLQRGAELLHLTADGIQGGVALLALGRHLGLEIVELLLIALHERGFVLLGCHRGDGHGTFLGAMRALPTRKQQEK